MKIFLSLNIGSPKDLLQMQDLEKNLKGLGIEVATPVDMQKGNLDAQSFQALDALIIDGGSQDAETGYLLAIALAHKKPVLYLLRKGSLLDSAVDALAKNAEVKKYLRIKFFTSDSLVRKVKEFLQYLDENIGKETFSIKYTLRLSSRLDRYIRWKANQSKKNKADFLRDLANDLMKNDEEYKRRLT